MSSMNICIVCSPDSYKTIPTPVRDGYNFDGRFSDKELTKKIKFTSTKDFEVIPEYDNNKCIIGYKDIEIFAKWKEKPKETTKKNTTVQKKSSTNTTKKKEEVKKDTPKNEATKKVETLFMCPLLSYNLTITDIFFKIILTVQFVDHN